MAGETERTVSIIIKAQDQAASVLHNLIASLASIEGIALLAGAAVTGFAYAFAKVTDAAAQQETADLRLAVALRSIGQNTAENREHLQRFAEGLSQVTGVSRDTIESATALIAQLSHLSGGALEDATRSALDLSAVMGGDLQSAARMVARVAEGNVTALRRFGIVIDETVPLSQRAAAGFQALHDHVAGVAEALGGSLVGQFNKAANAFTELEISIGKSVVQNEAFRAIFQVVGELLARVKGFVEGNSTAFQTLVTWGSKATIAFLEFGLQIANWEARAAEANITLLQYGVALGTLASVAPALFYKIFGVGKDTAISMAKAGGEALGTLEKAKTVTQSVEESTRTAIASIQATLGGLTGKAVTAGDAMGGIGKPPTKENLSELDKILRDLGQETMPQLAAQALEVDQALRLLVAGLDAGKITPEQYDHILAAITEITRKLPQWTDDQRAALVPLVQIRNLWLDISKDIDAAATDSTLKFSDTMIDAAFGAQVAWSQFFKQLMADFAKAIARALILKAVSGFFGFSAASDAQAAAGVGAGADFGIFSESIATPIQPASIILPGSIAASSPAADAASSLNTQPGAGPSASGVVQMFNQIVPQRGREADVADLIRDINRAVERHGMRLVASHVLA